MKFLIFCQCNRNCHSSTSVFHMILEYISGNIIVSVNGAIVMGSYIRIIFYTYLYFYVIKKTNFYVIVTRCEVTLMSLPILTVASSSNLVQTQWLNGKKDLSSTWLWYAVKPKFSFLNYKLNYFFLFDAKTKISQNNKNAKKKNPHEYMKKFWEDYFCLFDYRYLQ